jgi:hypothetical protein
MPDASNQNRKNPQSHLPLLRREKAAAVLQDSEGTHRKSENGLCSLCPLESSPPVVSSPMTGTLLSLNAIRVPQDEIVLRIRAGISINCGSQGIASGCYAPVPGFLVEANVLFLGAGGRWSATTRGQIMFLRHALTPSGRQLDSRFVQLRLHGRLA